MALFLCVLRPWQANYQKCQKLDIFGNEVYNRYVIM